jgi:hypothetical protein
VDEVKFGPRREIRLPSRCRRAFAVVIAASAIAAGAALAVTAAGSRGAAAPPAGAGGQSAAQRVNCPPAQAARPNLSALPAGMRPGALKVIGDAQFSGWCAVSG